jgi:hypothetical protein
MSCNIYLKALKPNIVYKIFTGLVICLVLSAIFKEDENGEISQELRRTRVACARCGSTWIEMVGVIVLQNIGRENVCFRVGIESENCQRCRFSPLECQTCGSKDVYEVELAGVESKDVPLTFKGIKLVSRE